MSIQVKLGQIAHLTPEGKFLVVEALTNLLKTKISFHAKFILSDIFDEVDAKTKKFREQYIALLKENGQEIKDENGNVLQVQAFPERLEFISEEIKKLHDLDIELPGEKLKLEDFKNVYSDDDSVYWVRWLFEKPVKVLEGDVISPN